MTLTPSEVASIARKLSFWEFAGYASEALVALGCFGEYVAEYTQWSTAERRHSLGRRSLLLLIFGISSGLLSLIQTKALSGEVIGSLGDQSKAASEKAAKAIRDADTAIGKARIASEESDAAKIASGKARSLADKTIVLSHKLSRRLAQEMQARVGIQKDILWRGPRYLIIDREVDRFSILQKYAGQKFAVRICMAQVRNRGDPEIVWTAGALWRVLTANKWAKDFGGMGQLDENCPMAGDGIFVFGRDDESPSVKDAIQDLDECPRPPSLRRWPDDRACRLPGPGCNRSGTALRRAVGARSATYAAGRRSGREKVDRVAVPLRERQESLGTLLLYEGVYTGYEGIEVQISEREQVLLETFRRLPEETAKELSALAQRLAALTPGTAVDWSDSWSEADLREFTAASLKRLDDEEREEPR